RIPRASNEGWPKKGQNQSAREPRSCGVDQRAGWRAPFIFFGNVSCTGVGGLRGALGAPSFLAAGFVTLCGDSALGGTALRTDTAGPPGQPMAAVPTWGVAASDVVPSGFALTWECASARALAACWAWV